MRDGESGTSSGSETVTDSEAWSENLSTGGDDTLILKDIWGQFRQQKLQSPGSRSAELGSCDSGDSCYTTDDAMYGSLLEGYGPSEVWPMGEAQDLIGLCGGS